MSTRDDTPEGNRTRNSWSSSS